MLVIFGEIDCREGLLLAVEKCRCDAASAFAAFAAKTAPVPCAAAAKTVPVPCASAAKTPPSPCAAAAKTPPSPCASVAKTPPSPCAAAAKTPPSPCASVAKTPPLPCPAAAPRYADLEEAVGVTVDIYVARLLALRQVGGSFDFNSSLKTMCGKVD